MSDVHAPPPLAPRAWLRWDLVQRQVRALAPATCLELGCGQGAVGTRLARMCDYLGVEPDPTSFAVAGPRITAAGGRVLRGDIDAVTPGSFFDLVCAFEVLEHLPDDVGALARWGRAVAPGGHLLLSVPAWQDRFGPWDEMVGHLRRYAPDELADRLRAAGFVEPQVVAYGWPLAYPLEAVRNRIAARRLAAGRGEGSAEERTASSARQVQPSRSGVISWLGTLPFRRLQRLRPGTGTGLVAWARRPVGS